MEHDHKLAAGLAGAAALTTAHQLTRLVRHDAPRMDVMGMRALERGLAFTKWIAPPRSLHAAALTGDLVSNALFYGLLLAGDARRPVWRGLFGGALAGAAALVLPRHIGLGTPPHSESITNRALTIGLYALGGTVAALAWRRLRHR